MRYCRAMTAAAHPLLQHGYAAAIVATVLDDIIVNKCRVYGIAGLQGSGKSTLTQQVAELAATRGLHAIALSIDDFYLGRRERLRLGRDVHPLLATRGAPRTHDVALACATIDSLVAGTPTRWPRFDKIADRRLPPPRWPSAIPPIDIILFDGWFLKVPPEPPSALREPINSLERDDDPQGIWRTYCNHALSGYAPLWQRIDRLLFLQGPGFNIVPDWRWQQEAAATAFEPQRETMSREAVDRFVLFFERISRHAMETLPTIADSVIRIDAQRIPMTA